MAWVPPSEIAEIYSQVKKIRLRLEMPWYLNPLIYYQAFSLAITLSSLPFHSQNKCIKLIIQSINRYLLSSYCAPDTVLVAEE